MIEASDRIPKGHRDALVKRLDSESNRKVLQTAGMDASSGVAQLEAFLQQLAAAQQTEVDGARLGTCHVNVMMNFTSACMCLHVVATGPCCV